MKTYLREYDAMETGRRKGLREGRQEGLKEGRQEEVIESIDVMVNSLNVSLERACELRGISVEEYNDRKEKSRLAN